MLTTPIATPPDVVAVMPAVVKAAPGSENVRLESVAVPTALPGHALLRVIATGICGTDIHVAHDEYACEPPVVMGHEILAEVTHVGAAADSAWIGRRVACETYFSACEECDQCRSGRRNLCLNRRSLGSFENGGFAPYVVMPVLNLHALPADLGEFDGVLAEPLACVTHCLLDPAVVNVGDRVLVTGPGAMGQLAAQVAAAQGGHVTIAGLERDTERLNIASQLGIITAVVGVEEHLRDEAFDVVIECSGSAAGAALALRAVKRHGRYIQVGIFGREITIAFDTVLYKELLVSSGFASTAESWRRAMALIDQGIVKLGPLITRTVPLSDFASAFKVAERGDGIKTIIIP